MEKNSPRIPHPSGLRPFIMAMTPQTIAAMMLPIATKIPLMPRRMKPAATGSEPARITECNMSGPSLRPTTWVGVQLVVEGVKSSRRVYGARRERVLDDDLAAGFGLM